MIKINLLAEHRPVARKGATLPKLEFSGNAENLLYAGIVIVAVLFCGYKWWSLSSERRRVDRAVADARREVEEVREGLRIIAELEAKKKLIDQQVDIISQLKKARTIPVDLMNQVNVNLPDFLWFRSMTENGNQLSFNGRATTPNAPANLYNNLTVSPYFNDVSLNQIAKDPDGVTFSLTCRFIPGGQPPPQG